MPTPSIQIQFENVSKIYLKDRPLFKDLNLVVSKGEFLFLTGVSGAGKSTLLNMIMGIEKPDSGRVLFNGVEVNSLNDGELNFHRRKVGMVFQDYKLIEKKTAKYNISMPLKISGMPSSKINSHLNKISRMLGIQSLLQRTVESLSGGEQQLVALARAAVHRPPLILADEPTANLDKTMADRIFDNLNLLSEKGITVIFSTHDVHLIKAQKRRTLLIRHSAVVDVR